ncbi:hypothetical protein ACS0TY_028883 [Phlomoides rotata]
MLCEKKEETGNHVFFECEVAHKIWMCCFEWLGIATVLHSDPCVSLLAHSYMFKGNKSRQKTVAIWLCVV